MHIEYIDGRPAAFFDSKESRDLLIRCTFEEQNVLVDPEPKKNPLNGVTCYLSGAIERCVAAHNWRTRPKEILSEKYGINVFDPFDDEKQQWVPILNKARNEKNYDLMTKIAQRFVRKDLKLVDKADLLIAYLPKDVPTTGTHHEIIFADAHKIPTLLVCPESKAQVSAWYFGFIPHECMFGSWDELYEFLDRVQRGELSSNRRWHFIYDMI